MQALNQALIHELVKEIHLLRGILQHITNHMLQHSFRHHHIVRQVGKSHLRLNHPKLCRMSCGIRILRPEGRTKSIYVLKRKSIRLHVQLSAHCQVGGLTEESTSPSAVMGRFFISMVVTWNISPAPSQSLPVMIGVCTYTNPLSWKKV